MNVAGHFETTRLTERRGRFTSKCGLARNDTGTACQKLTYAPQQGVSFSQWAGRINLRCYAPSGRCRPKSRPSKVKGWVLKAVV
jgi:hypothetical protein